jgi:hypothetical protein
MTKKCDSSEIQLTFLISIRWQLICLTQSFNPFAMVVGEKDEAPLSLSSSHSSSPRKEDASKKLNLQKTVLLEYIVQASDIVHTMQHFSIYQKWNHKLFEEEYDAFRAGRLDQDPSEDWYENELHFFDT